MASWLRNPRKKIFVRASSAQMNKNFPKVGHQDAPGQPGFWIWASRRISLWATAAKKFSGFILARHWKVQKMSFRIEIVQCVDTRGPKTRNFHFQKAQTVSLLACPIPPLYMMGPRRWQFSIEVNLACSGDNKKIWLNLHLCPQMQKGHEKRVGRRLPKTGVLNLSIQANSAVCNIHKKIFRPHEVKTLAGFMYVTWIQNVVPSRQ